MIRPALLHEPSKTYATRESAVKAFEKVCRYVGAHRDEDDMSYLVCTAENGRFYCVGLPNAEQVQMAIAMAHNGVPVVRR